MPTKKQQADGATPDSPEQKDQVEKDELLTGTDLTLLHESKKSGDRTKIQGMEIPEKGVLLIITKIAPKTTVPVIASLFVADLRIVDPGDGKPVLWGNNINILRKTV
jgi:hypothetical protein